MDYVALFIKLGCTTDQAQYLFAYGCRDRADGDKTFMDSCLAALDSGLPVDQILAECDLTTVSPVFVGRNIREIAARRELELGIEPTFKSEREYYVSIGRDFLTYRGFNDD